MASPTPSTSASTACSRATTPSATRTSSTDASSASTSADSHASPAPSATHTDASATSTHSVRRDRRSGGRASTWSAGSGRRPTHAPASAVRGIVRPIARTQLSTVSRSVATGSLSSIRRNAPRTPETEKSRYSPNAVPTAASATVRTITPNTPRPTESPVARSARRDAPGRRRAASAIALATVTARSIVAPNPATITPPTRSE